MFEHGAEAELHLGEGLSLPHEQAQKIGRQIWKNECGEKIDGLTSWNKGEEFASLGIGHFIWYPEDTKGRFIETFPRLIVFLNDHHEKIPEWLLKAKGCPWKSKEDFQKDFNSEKMVELRELLVKTVELQLLFIVERTQRFLPTMLSGKSSQMNAQIAFKALAASPNGIYALVDYINFKGEGTSINEKYHGEGWGLLQVLELMPIDVTSETAVHEFIIAAKKVLEKRVRNSAPERQENQWLKGWLNRVETYAKIPF